MRKKLLSASLLGVYLAGFFSGYRFRFDVEDFFNPQPPTISIIDYDNYITKHESNIADLSVFEDYADDLQLYIDKVERFDELELIWTIHDSAKDLAQYYRLKSVDSDFAKKFLVKSNLKMVAAKELSEKLHDHDYSFPLLPDVFSVYAELY